MTSIHLSIAGISSQIRFIGNKDFYREVINRYKNFLLSPDNTKKAVNLSVQLIKSHPHDTTDDPLYVNEIKDRIAINSNGISCRIYKYDGQWKGSGIIEENIYQFDTFLRLLWSHLLIKNQGFLIHSCAITHKNRGYLFAGKSGKGKTTLANKSPRSQVLSDEIVAIKIIKDRPYIVSTPFWGEFRKGRNPILCPLASIYFLQKGKEMKLLSLSPKHLIQKILKNVLYFGRSGSSARELLSLLSEYLLNIPAYRISLARDTEYSTLIKTISQVATHPVYTEHSECVREK
ncbi:MAG: hypothetical protein QME51_11725 [Planctomycetota bacterium]|nr:hypothetical protein [Planctomycetota bacterium]